MYGIVCAHDIMVPMRDGLRLATDIYRPAQNGEAATGRWPAVLWRTAYNKRSAWLLQSVVETLVPKGYAVVLQDVRGRYRSESDGTYAHIANPLEGADGFDSVEWIGAQPWSDGRVGTVGVSQGAVAQSALALHSPPHLSALFMEDGPFNWFTNGARQGGAFELSIVGQVFQHALESRESLTDPAVARAVMAGKENIRTLLLQFPIKRGCTPLSAVPGLEKVLFDYYTRGSYDEFWQMDCMNFEEHLDRFADVPTFLKCGWFDHFSLGNGEYYVQLAARKESPLRLIFGPWVHGAEGYSNTYAGDVDFGPTAALGAPGGLPSLEDIRLEWFDRWLKGIPNGVETRAPVLLFVMGGGDGRRNRDGRLNHGGVWREEWEWPLARTQFTTYHMRSGGLLSPEAPGEADPPLTFEYDPSHPVPTIGTCSTGMNELLPPTRGVRRQWQTFYSRMRPILIEGAADQKEEPHILGSRPPYPRLSGRPDVLVFQTPPLTKDVEVTGPVTVKLWVSSSARDTDFTAKLIDVCPANEDYPMGFDMNLTDSIIRMRFRAGFERELPMEPGQVYEATIQLAPISNLFKAGHRIRVDISSSNFPRFDPNPNTGEPLGQHTHLVRALNTVHVQRSRPSHITLPVVPGPLSDWPDENPRTRS